MFFGRKVRGTEARLAVTFENFQDRNSLLDEQPHQQVWRQMNIEN
jgi:hypothetical protein